MKYKAFIVLRFHLRLVTIFSNVINIKYKGFFYFWQWSIKNMVPVKGHGNFYRRDAGRLMDLFNEHHIYNITFSFFQT